MKFVIGSMRLLPLLVFPLVIVGCGGTSAPTVVEQQAKSPEVLAKEAADYDAQMDAN